MIQATFLAMVTSILLTCMMVNSKDSSCCWMSPAGRLKSVCSRQGCSQ